MFVEELQKVNFSNYERFSCIDAAYTDFLNIVMKVVNEIPPSKELRIKNNTQECFETEIAELIHACNFFFYLSFLSQPYTNHRHAGEGGGHFFNSSVPLPLASQTRKTLAGRSLQRAHLIK